MTEEFLYSTKKNEELNTKNKIENKNYFEKNLLIYFATTQKYNWRDKKF